MSKILIIGNGFDLYHKLPTRYTDFLFFMNHWKDFKANYDVSAVKTDKTGQISIRLSESGCLTDESLVDFALHKGCYDDANLNCLNENAKSLWIDYFNERMPQGKNWIDFEDEIYRALQQVEGFYDSLPQLAGTGKVVGMGMPSAMIRVIKIFNEKVQNEDRNTLGIVKKSDVEPEKLKKNKTSLLSTMKQELDKLNICLNLYLLEFVNRMKCETFSPQIRDLAEVHLLDFNYTHTYKTIYGDDNILDMHSIHGDIYRHNMVLGIPDDTFENSLDYIYFQKYFQRIQKKTGNDYKKWIVEPYAPSLNETRTEVYIMGHSLSAVDKGVLKIFFNPRYVKRVTIFYHSQSAYENMVINLVDMFGKDFVIENVETEYILFERLDSPEKK